ncbi:MAG: HAD-IB family hydrolase [Chlamydiales bacterium]
MSFDKNKGIVAVFDFDKTLTRCDTFMPFLYHSFGVFPTLIKSLKLIPSVFSFILGKKNRQELKEVFLTAFFKGISIDRAREMGRNFASAKISQLLKKRGIQRLRWHQEQQHHCVIVSASLDLYLKPWAESIHISEVLCSKAALDEHQNLTGKLDGLNCRGPEKVRRLKELLGDTGKYTIYAYGDSEGDRELLRFADYPFYRSFES